MNLRVPSDSSCISPQFKYEAVFFEFPLWENFRGGNFETRGLWGELRVPFIFSRYSLQKLLRGNFRFSPRCYFWKKWQSLSSNNFLTRGDRIESEGTLRFPLYFPTNVMKSRIFEFPLLEKFSRGKLWNEGT